MPRWTPEQQLAIDKENTNIIVSAGAGSGKTAVLSERVIRKLEQGVDVDHLLILTFTKAAAFEMMIRIRNKIKEKPHLEGQLKKIDSSYITTFDSFSLSLVKKYHYLLNIKRDIKITNQTIIDKERTRILDKIFEEYYEKEDERFLKLLEDFTNKDDIDIKNLILSMNKKLDLKYDKIPYLMNYLKNYQELTKEQKTLFNAFLRQKIEGIKDGYLQFSSFVDGKYLENVSIELEKLFNSRSYDEIKTNSLNIKFKNLPRGSEEIVKKEKEKLTSLIKELQELLIYENEEEIDTCLKEQEKYLDIIIEIILKLDQEIYNYKYSHDAYEFTDISKMAIKLVKEYEEIRNELKFFFNEIMVDEYQDTSDLQEEFISAIENNNVYMVGDIKQSIYRFRNANPYIFKNKYDSYGKGIGGFKIDLMKNFRSRKEVLQNINDVFDPVMDDYLGGCNYRESHRMVFGNTTYEEKKPEQNADFEVYNYLVEDGFTKDEMEAFIIMKDIKEKIDNHYQVIDRETFELRDIEYQDFAILMDRATKFDLYKKIFEYYHIPMAVYKDTTITKEDDVYIFSNLFKLIYHAFNKNYDKDFEYAFMSVARSYLINMSDSEIFEIIRTKSYQTSEVYQKLLPIINKYQVLNGESLIEEVLTAFNFYEKQILVGNMEHLMARVSYLKSLFQEMASLGYSLDEAILMFNEMVEEGQDIKVSFNEEQSNAVKIMTIHKSKGLEFPILYMAGLSNSFNIRDLNDKFIFDNKYGFILPFFKEEEKTSIAKFLMKNTYLEEEISEKIRLFYVALTRAREKMILLTNNDKEEYEKIEDNVLSRTKFKYRSFLDLLKSVWSILIPYKREINTKELDLSKDYNFIQKFNYEKNLAHVKDKFTYKEVKVEVDEEDSAKFSKTVTELLTKENLDSIELGLHFHEIFETLDFKNPDYSYLSNFEKQKVEAFLNNPILEGIDSANIIKEYEFAYRDNNQLKHGIIDLLIEFNDKVLIIDYKLKHIIDNAYKKQLQGYKDYISLKTDKPIYIYLYSIIDGTLNEVK